MKPLDHALDQLDELLMTIDYQEQQRLVFDVRRVLLKIKQDGEWTSGSSSATFRLEKSKAFEDDLPPIDADMRKKLTSIDVSCPVCKVKPGAKCVKMTMRGKNGKPTDESIDKYHVPRRERAKARNS